MAKVCKNCGKELSLLDRFTGSPLCDDCFSSAAKSESQAKLAHIEESIKASHKCRSREFSEHATDTLGVRPRDSF